MSTRMRRNGPGFLGLVALGLVVRVLQAQESVPAFSSRAEAITVDVVVVGKDGQPVKDLDTADFTLFEDGRPQPIVGFERRVLPPGTEEPEDTMAGETNTASNEADGRPAGRTLVFLVDDLGIERLRMTEVAKVLSGWLAGGADAADEVTVVTTSGDAWWSDTVGEGRADFEAVLGRLKGKKFAPSQEAMSDWEAFSIDTFSSAIEEPSSVGGGPPTGLGGCTTNSPASNVRDRVVDRWFRTQACLCEPMAIRPSIDACRALVNARARQVYSAASQRATALLGGIERISLGLAGARGRKSVIVLSEGLLRDSDQRAFERAVDASRRGNTAVSFVDVRGLVGMSFYSAADGAGAVPKSDQVGVMTMEAALLETAGGESIAQTTGGTLVSNTNDLAGGVARLANELSAYYLLGYQSDRPVDGKWHKLEVKVARPGVTVRARRGYFASPETSTRVASGGKKDKAKKRGKEGSFPSRSLDPALAVGGERSEIPLRIAPYVLETDASGKARVLVAVEVGTSPLTFSGSGGVRKAQIDITVLGVSRDQPSTVSLDSHVDLGVDSRAVGGWWTFTRELRLPPGPAQIRVFVQEAVSGRGGLVAQRVVVPSSDGPYLSTPILTDSLSPSAERGGSARLMPVAHRRFRPAGQLYCAYEVHLALGKRELDKIPKVDGGYTIEDASGRVVASAPPTPIAIALGAQITRVVSIPLDRFVPGRYRLTIQATDSATGAMLQATETFWVEADVSGGAKGY